MAVKAEMEEEAKTPLSGGNQMAKEVETKVEAKVEAKVETQVAAQVEANVEATAFSQVGAQ